MYAEEHVKNWSLYNPVSDVSIMSVSDWSLVFSGHLHRNRLDPDYLSRLNEYASELMLSLKKLGKEGPFWTPG